MISYYIIGIRHSRFFLYIEMNRGTPFLVAFLALSLLGTLATAITVQPPSPIIFANSGQVVPFLVSLNTVNGKAYYAKISISAHVPNGMLAGTV